MFVHWVLSRIECGVDVLQNDDRIGRGCVQQVIQSATLHTALPLRHSVLPVIVKGSFAQRQHADAVAEMTGQGRDVAGLASAGRAVEQVATTIWHASVCVPEPKNTIFFGSLYKLHEESNICHL